MQLTESSAARRSSAMQRLTYSLTAGLLFGLVASTAQNAAAAEAQWTEYFGADHTASRADKDKDAKSTPAITGPLFAVISIADQNIAFYGADGVVARSGVSTGMRGHPTPTGLFTIVQKKKFHRSNLYSSAPMPYMQRLTWSGIALHAGVLPGYPASHGCIRMPGEFAMRMFKATRMNQRVIISPRGVTPTAFAHEKLPVPHMVMVEAPAEASAQPADATAALSANKGPQGGVLENVSIDAPAAAPAEPRRLNPLQAAAEMKRSASEKAKTAALATKAAQMSSVTKATELRIAQRKLASAESALEDAKDKIVASQRRLEKAEADRSEGEADVTKAAEGRKAAEAAVETAQANLAAAQRKLDEAEAVKSEREAAVAKAAEAKKAAEAAVDAARSARAQEKAESAKTESEKTEAVKAEGENAEAKPAAVGTADPKAAEAVSAETALQTAKSNFSAADRALDEARDARSDSEKAVSKAASEKKAADRALENAQDKVAAAQRRLEKAEAAKADSEAAITKATEAKAAAEAAVPDAQKAYEEARSASEAKAHELEAARQALTDARAAGKAAAEMLVEANRRTEPLSVFISRKTNKLYVRQNWRPVMEAPVSFNEPDRQVGTHIYISTHAGADGESLNWWALSMPPEAEVKPASKESKRSRKEKAKDAPKEADAAAPAAPLPPETAAGALDRVIIPEETKQRLAELAWVGTSVIISDHGISGETGETTDFVILTRSK